MVANHVIEHPPPALPQTALCTTRTHENHPQGTMLRALISSYATLPAMTRRELDDRVKFDLCRDVGPSNQRRYGAHRIDHRLKAGVYQYTSLKPVAEAMCSIAAFISFADVTVQVKHHAFV